MCCDLLVKTLNQLLFKNIGRNSDKAKESLLQHFWTPFGEDRRELERNQEFHESFLFHNKFQSMTKLVGIYTARMES